MTDEAANISELKRLPNGHFAPGSGGRPRGSRNRTTIESIAAIQSLKDPAFKALADNIKAGDQRAVEFVLSRILPTGRLLELPGGSPGDIVDGLVSGQISPNEAKEIATAIARLQELDQLEALKARLDDLERLLKDGSE